MASKQYIWLNGKFIDFNNAKVHILTHSLQYGSGIFEGIRAYQNGNRAAIFRLGDHVKRFINTAKIYSMDLGFSEDELNDAIIGLVRKNKLHQCYIRPFAYYDDTRIGLSTEGKKVSVSIAAIPFGNYFQNKGKGISCKVSSWKRINSEIMPPLAKASGNYRNSILASQEAKASGADEAIYTDNRAGKQNALQRTVGVFGRCRAGRELLCARQSEHDRQRQLHKYRMGYSQDCKYVRRMVRLKFPSL